MSIEIITHSDGEIHILGDRIIARACMKNGYLTYYNAEGKIHRDDDKPAMIKKDASGKIIDAYWYKDGKLHRDNGPAVDRGDNGTEKIWYRHGIRHRDGDLPAYIADTETGRVFIEGYYKDGKKHRENGPAYIVYSPDGTANTKQWYLNDTRCEPANEPSDIMAKYEAACAELVALKQKIREIIGA